MQNTNDLETTNVAEYSLGEGCRGLHSVRLPLLRGSKDYQVAISEESILFT